MNELIAALLGATIAFLFLRLADFLNKVFEREELNYKALIIYQHLLNEYGIINDKNIKIIDNYGASIDPTKLNVNFDTFHEYPINKEMLRNLTNVDLVNEIYIFNAVLDGLNANLSTLSRVNGIMAQGIIDGNIEHELYEQTIENIKKNLKNRRVDFIDSFQGIRSLLYTINFLIEKKPLFYRIIRLISNTKLPKYFVERRKIKMEKPYKILEKYNQDGK